MKLRSPQLWLFVVLLVATIWFVSQGSGGAGPSALSKGPKGWAAAKTYLELSGQQVHLLTDLEPGPEAPGALVTAFPWQPSFQRPLLTPLIQHAKRGGLLVVAYSGLAKQQSEEELFSALQIVFESSRPDSPLHPLGWWRHQREEWRLERSPCSDQEVATRDCAASTPARDVGPLAAPDRLPLPPAKAQALYRLRGRDTSRAAIFSFPLGKGEVWLLPAAALSNAYLSKGDHSEVLETLMARSNGTWAFDEAAHGLVDESNTDEPKQTLAFDLLALHLLLMYGLALVALVRRFGTVWREPVLSSGPASGFLLGMGSLHDRLGHYRDGAQQLLKRSQQWERHLEFPEDFQQRASEVTKGTWLEFARDVSRFRRKKGRHD